jgi:metal-responsive CopG/Arc/MetJ family transcriptional regulator
MKKKTTKSEVFKVRLPADLAEGIAKAAGCESRSAAVRGLLRKALGKGSGK